MERVVFKIKNNIKIAKNVYEMTLEGNTSAITKAGTYGLYLR